MPGDGGDRLAAGTPGDGDGQDVVADGGRSAALAALCPGGGQAAGSAFADEIASISAAIVATMNSIFSAMLCPRGLCSPAQMPVRMCRLTSRTCPGRDAPHGPGRAGRRTRPTIWADPEGVLSVLRIERFST
jgi:hypothetical protein